MNRDGTSTCVLANVARAKHLDSVRVDDGECDAATGAASTQQGSCKDVTRDA